MSCLATRSAWEAKKYNMKMHVFLKRYASCGNKNQKPVLSTNIIVKLTRSLTLVSLERVLLIEYAFQIFSVYLVRFKSYSKGCNRQYTNRQTDKQTGQNNMTRIIRSGGIKNSCPKWDSKGLYMNI